MLAALGQEYGGVGLATSFDFVGFELLDSGARSIHPGLFHPGVPAGSVVDIPWTEVRVGDVIQVCLFRYLQVPAVVSGHQLAASSCPSVVVAQLEAPPHPLRPCSPSV